MKNIKLIILVVIISSNLIYSQKESKPMTSSVTRRDLLTAIIDSVKPISSVEIKEVTMGPKVKAPLHLHPCTTVGVITEGTITFQIEGQPIKYLKVGDAFYEPKDVRVAKFDNEGDIPAKFVVFYLQGEDKKETIHILTK